MSVSDWLLLVALSTMWGASFLFVRIAIVEIPPLTLAWLRVAIAAAILFVLVRLLGDRTPFRRLWLAFAVMGLFNNAIPFSLFAWAQMHIPSGLASILNATTPLFTVLIAHFATVDDKLTPARAVGLLAGFAGVVIMIGPDMLLEIGSHVAAQLACLLAALSYGIAGSYGRRFRGEKPLVVATGQLLGSSILLAPVAFLTDQPWLLQAPSPKAIAAIVAMAALSTALGYVIFFRILDRAGATNVMLGNFLIPLSAILLGALFLDERMEPRHFAGMAAIALGLAAIDGRPWQYLTNAMGRAPAGP